MNPDCDPQAYRTERLQMVERQLARRGLQDERVLAAMTAVPRHCFVPPEYHDLAYHDGPLPIGSGQTISQPYIVAYMTQLLHLTGGETVLEIGTGSGYQAAVLSHLAEQVYSIERFENLAQIASQRFTELEIHNVQVVVGDGTQGLPEHAPYQGILVTAAAPSVPRPLLNQLAEGGRIVLPVGKQYGQYLEVWTRKGQEFLQDVLAPVAFVPLIGKDGWETDNWYS